MKEDLNGLIKRAEILEKYGVKNKTLLDIGAGPLATIEARDFNCQVTSIDISEAELKEAIKEAVREKVGQKIKFEKADATDLPYPVNHFDVVISYGALHHISLQKRKKFIQEVSRVAKEKIIIVELNQAGFKHLHSFDNYQLVDLDWLEKELNSLGKTEKYLGKLMNVYACFKKMKKCIVSWSGGKEPKD